MAIFLFFERDRYGYWGVCFIYGTFFALRALSSTGKTYDNSEAVYKGVKFLLSIQNEEGGWGESHLSCPTEVIFFSMNTKKVQFFYKNVLSVTIIPLNLFPKELLQQK